MALSSPARAVDISAALSQLDALDADEYFIAFDPLGRQFCGTPHGYSAYVLSAHLDRACSRDLPNYSTQLPPKVMTDLLSGQVKKVTWASFGSDHPSSYFFAYVMKDGSPSHRTGKTVPSTLRPFLDYVSRASFELSATLRVQLGANRSWAAWAGNLWACKKVPLALQETLCQLSLNHREDESGMKGVLRASTLTNITWHANGSYYVNNREHSWSFESDTIKRGWNDLWSGLQHVSPHEPTDLAVSIRPK
jgi:hypothetical protein